MERITLFIGDQTPEEFRQKIYDTVHAQDREYRFKLYKMYRDAKGRAFPPQDWRNADRNEACREVENMSVWNVTMVIVVFGPGEEFAQIY